MPSDSRTVRGWTSGETCKLGPMALCLQTQCTQRTLTFQKLQQLLVSHAQSFAEGWSKQLIGTRRVQPDLLATTPALSTWAKPSTWRAASNLAGYVSYGLCMPGKGTVSVMATSTSLQGQTLGLATRCMYSAEKQPKCSHVQLTTRLITWSLRSCSCALGFMGAWHTGQESTHGPAPGNQETAADSLDAPPCVYAECFTCFQPGPVFLPW